MRAVVPLLRTVDRMDTVDDHGNRFVDAAFGDELANPLDARCLHS